MASAWLAQHPGARLFDIELLRTDVPGWESDFIGTGRRLRSEVISRIAEVLRDGGEVVLPEIELIRGLQSKLEEMARRGFRVEDAPTVDEAVAQIEAACPTT